jgi:hypothetical protein
MTSGGINWKKADQFYTLPIKFLNKLGELDFHYNTKGELPNENIVKMDRLKNFYRIYANPVVLTCRSHFKWEAGQMEPLPYNEPQKDELGHLRPLFDSNPWKDFFAFTNALFRDFYFETADNAEGWRDLATGETLREELLLNQPLVVQRF